MPEDCSSAQVCLDIRIMWRQQIYNLLVRFPFAARIAHWRRIIGKVDDDVKKVCARQGKSATSQADGNIGK
jgi:hypothetical protein